MAYERVEELGMQENGMWKTRSLSSLRKRAALVCPMSKPSVGDKWFTVDRSLNKNH